MKSTRRLPALAPVAVMVSLLAGATAHADAIDGEWCHADGRHLAIRGPQIQTPGGNRMEGIYDRHGFSYVVPTPEAGSGQTVAMILRNEETVLLQQGGGEVQVWRRCKERVS